MVHVNVGIIIQVTILAKPAWRFYTPAWNSVPNATLSRAHAYALALGADCLVPRRPSHCGWTSGNEASSRPAPARLGVQSRPQTRLGDLLLLESSPPVQCKLSCCGQATMAASRAFSRMCYPCRRLCLPVLSLTRTPGGRHLEWSSAFFGPVFNSCERGVWFVGLVS